MVEGVEVSTEHWIGGERVPSGSTFTDISPIDEEPIAEVARGGAEEATRSPPIQCSVETSTPSISACAPVAGPPFRSFAPER